MSASQSPKIVGSTWIEAQGEKTVFRPLQSPHSCGETIVEPGTGTSAARFATRPIGGLRLGWFKALSAALTTLILCSLWTNAASPGLAAAVSFRSLPHYARAVTTSLLEVFQVYPPVLTVTPEGVLEITDGSSNATVDIINSNRPTCQKVLAIHSFAYSYGKPFIGNYTPPPCAFNRVTWNLTVTSAGRQFDRLGSVYLGDIEVYRTSTAEPTSTGIEWTYLKVCYGSVRYQSNGAFVDTYY